MRPAETDETDGEVGAGRIREKLIEPGFGCWTLDERSGIQPSPHCGRGLVGELGDRHGHGAIAQVHAKSLLGHPETPAGCRAALQ